MGHNAASLKLTPILLALLALCSAMPPASAQAPPVLSPERDRRGPASPEEKPAEPTPGRVQALLMVHRVPPSMVHLPNVAEFNPQEFEVYKATQVALINSQVVLSAALDIPGVREILTQCDEDHPADWLNEHLEITFPESAELMQIELAGTDTQDMRDVLDAVLDAYLQNVVHEETHKRVEVLDFCRRQYGMLQDDIARKQAQMVELQQNASDDDGPNIEMLALEFELELLRDSLREIHQQVRMLEFEVAGLTRVQLLMPAQVVE